MDQRQHILAFYVRRMSEQPGFDNHYPAADTIRWLGWLARGMARHGQVEFRIEGLQPSWLERCGDRRRYELGIRLLSSLLFLICGLIAGAGLYVAGNFPLAQVGMVGFVIGMLFAVPHMLASVIARWVRPWLAIGVTAGLMVLCTAPFPSLGDVAGRLIVGLVFGVPVAFAGTAIAASEPITMAERLAWSWKRAAYGLALGLGVNPTHEVIRLLEEFKKSQKAKNTDTSSNA